MSRSRNKQNKFLSIAAGCILAFAIGYFMVEFISTREKPPLGMTFHVIVGCLLMCISAIVFFVQGKQLLFPKKKKKKGSKPVFLDKEHKIKDGN